MQPKDELLKLLNNYLSGSKALIDGKEDDPLVLFGALGAIGTILVTVLIDIRDILDARMKSQEEAGE